MTDNELGAAALPPTDHRNDCGVHRRPSVPFEKRYTFIKGLGAGGEATCDRYESADANANPYKTVAVKTLTASASHDLCLHEANIIAKIPQHPRIIEFLEVYQETCLRIVMPLHSGGDLCSLLQRFSMLSCKIPEAFCWHFLQQVSHGLHHIHQHGVLHRDLKPENLLIDLTPHGVLFDDIKIIDFGMASDTVHPHKHYGGTPRFQPPEAPLASTAADVYAIGATLHYLLTCGLTPKGKVPEYVMSHEHHIWYSQAKCNKIQRIVHQDHTDFRANTQLSHAEASKATLEHPTPLPAKGYSPLLEYWMLRLLDPNPATRATTAEIITDMAEDAGKQIELYQKWITASGKRPRLGFVYPEPPPGWRP